MRCFRETFARELAEAGFEEAITPFITANAGYDPLKDRELRGGRRSGMRVTPQFIGKDPAALVECLRRVREAGYDTADLNAGCPYPMVRNKGRGSGLLRSKDTLRRMLDAGCGTMGPDRFSLKVRLGVDSPDELLSLMPTLNGYPLRFLTVHARTARQMYAGECDVEALARVEAEAAMPVVRNGDLLPTGGRIMVGRAFVRMLGERGDSRALLAGYIVESLAELTSEQAVLGRIKELVAYWKDLPQWERRWRVMKLARSVDELLSLTR